MSCGIHEGTADPCPICAHVIAAVTREAAAHAEALRKEGGFSLVHRRRRAARAHAAALEAARKTEAA